LGLFLLISVLKGSLSAATSQANGRWLNPANPHNITGGHRRKLSVGKKILKLQFLTTPYLQKLDFAHNRVSTLKTNLF
jgi:hypothetical protein